jgi:hypothetical protein
MKELYNSSTSTSNLIEPVDAAVALGVAAINEERDK